jgi:hypothetical protein
MSSNLKFTIGSAQRQTQTQYNSGSVSAMLKIEIAGGVHPGVLAEMILDAHSYGSAGPPVCSIVEATSVITVRVANANYETSPSFPYTAPEIGHSPGIDEGCPNEARSQFTIYSRWALRVQTSSYHKNTNTFDNDGYAAFYWNETLLHEFTNILIPYTFDPNTTLIINFATPADGSNYWIIEDSIVPPTNSSGQIPSPPFGLLFIDDFSTGIDLTRWINSGGAYARNDIGPGGTSGVGGLNTSPSIWWPITSHPDWHTSSALIYEKNYNDLNIQNCAILCSDNSNEIETFDGDIVICACGGGVFQLDSTKTNDLDKAIPNPYIVTALIGDE